MFLEMTREESRIHSTKQLRRLHKEILARQIFTPQQIIDDHERYLMAQNVPRGNVALIIKQSNIYVK